MKLPMGLSPKNFRVCSPAFPYRLELSLVSDVLPFFFYPQYEQRISLPFLL